MEELQPENENTESISAALDIADTGIFPSEVCAEHAPKTETKRFKIFGVEFVYLCFLAICMGFIGWIAENFVRVISVGIIDSRYHILPCIGEYGFIVFAFHFVLGTPNNITFFGKKLFKKENRLNKVISNILTYVIMCAAVFAGEIGFGNLWDKVFGLQLWDYSNLPLCVTRYAGLIPSLGYGTMAYLIFKFAYTPLLNLIRKGGSKGYNVFKIIDCTLGVLILVDFIVMLIFFMAFQQQPMWWSIQVWQGV